MGTFLKVLYILTNLVFATHSASLHHTQFPGRQRFIDNIVGVTCHLAFRVSGQWKTWAGDWMEEGGMKFSSLLPASSAKKCSSCLEVLSMQLPSLGAAKTHFSLCASVVMILCPTVPASSFIKPPPLSSQSAPSLSCKDSGYVLDW